MIFNEIINNIIDDYLNAWNGKDVKKIIGIFSENGEFESPIFRMTNPACFEAKVIGKEKLENSYKILFNSPSYFKMNKLSIEKHDKTVITYVNSQSNDIVLKSIFTINEYGKLEYLNIVKM